MAQHLGECSMSDESSSYPPIADCAIIGDCRSAALISRVGSVDWLCLPKFDVPSMFAALLDRRRGRCFMVRPTPPFTTAQRYVDDTNVAAFDVAGGGDRAEGP